MNRGSHSVITTPSLDPYDPLHDPPPYTINNERHGAPHSPCPGRCWRQAAAGHEPDVYVVFRVARLLRTLTSGFPAISNPAPAKQQQCENTRASRVRGGGASRVSASWLFRYCRPC
jgi:hypothetical protein